MKQTLVLAGAVAAAFVLGGCGHTTPITSGTATPSPTYSPNVSSEYTIPTANSQPAGIVRTANALWFTEAAGDKIGSLNENAVVIDYPLPNANSKPLNVTVGQDGNLWLTEFGGDAIAKFNVATLGFTECQLSPAPTSGTPTPYGIAPGQDGNLWVTDPGSNGIWVIQPGCGMYAFYPLKTANADPTSITVGPDTALWFVEAGVDKIGRIPIGAASGTMPTEYPVSAGAGLGVIVSGADNALWFTESKSDKLGRMLTTGAYTETALTGVGSPYGLVLGPDGNFYIGDQTKSAIVQYITATKTMTSYPTKTANAGPYALTIGPDNEVYFTEQTANQIGQFLYFNP